jgi:Ni/Co efflux regulator RcnB
MHSRYTPIILLSMLLAASAGARADKGGTPHHDKHARPNHHAPAVQVEFHFGEREREAARAYYGAPERAGRCPPGLSKKGHHCLPPGQARKWRVGQPLPRGIIYHDLPADLRLRLPPPPEGHRYVRVAADILLIAIGTSMIVDAMEDIVR